MKILIVTQYFYPEFFIVNSFAEELHKKGHQVEVLTGLPNYPKGEIYPKYSFFKGPWTEDYHGVRVARVPLLPRKKGFVNLFINYVSFVFFATFLGLFRIKNKPDVIFCFGLSPVTSCLPAIFFKWFYRKPLSFWVQDLWPESLAAVGVTQSKIILNMVGVIVRFIYSQCDHILIQSQAFKESVLCWGARESQLHYVPNWAAKLSMVRSEPKWLSDLPKGFRVIFAGNIGKAQDMPTLLEAASYLQRNFPEITDIHWIIVGEGSERLFLENEAKKRSLNRIHTYGQKPNADMPFLFSEADVLLVILKNETIFSLTVPSKIQSYMSGGRPILASVNGEGARIVAEAGVGLSCPAEDPVALSNAILKLYRMSPEDKVKMGNAGKAYFEKNYDQELVVDKIIHLFKTLT